MSEIDFGVLRPEASAPQAVRIEQGVAPARARATGRRRRLTRRVLVAADVAGLLAAFAVAESVITASSPDAVTTGREALLVLVGIPFWILLASAQRLYESDARRAAHSTVDDLAGVFNAVTVAVALVYGGSWLSELARPPLEKVAVFWGVAIALILLLRLVARAGFRRREAFVQDTVVVGAGAIGQLVARKLRQRPSYGVNVVGFLDAAPQPLRSDIGEVKVIGAPADLPTIVDSLGIERVIVAFDTASDIETLDVIRSLGGRDVEVDIVPRLFDLFGPHARVQDVDGLPLVGIGGARMPRVGAAIKRALDIAIASCSLLVFSPVMLAIALWIRKDSDGPILFRQTRVGNHQQPFTMLKFRSMRTGTSLDDHREHTRKAASRVSESGSDGLYKLDRTDVTTRPGKILRRTSLDELPQLINVLRGDMSIVGPRPCLDYEIEFMEPHHLARFGVRPGMTGLWQVTARNRASFGEALDLDVAYVRGWSIWLDLKIILRTPAQMLPRSNGAR